MHKIDFKKIILAGLAVNIASFVFPFLSYKFFSWIFELEPTYIWKWTPSISLWSMTANWLLILFVVNTLIAIFLAFLYAVFFQSIPSSGIKKGIIFGLLLFPIAVIMPMFSIYILVNVAPYAVVYFTLEGLLEFIIYGGIISLIYKKENNEKY